MDEYVDGREVLLRGLRTCYENAVYDKGFDCVIGWDTSTDRIGIVGFTDGKIGIVESGPRHNAICEKYRRT